MEINIEGFKGIDTLKHPTKINDESLTVLENMRIDRGRIGTLTKRGGYGRYNANQLGSASKPIMSMFEANFEAGTKLLLNNDNDSSSGLFEVATPYTGSYTAVTGANGASMQSALSHALSSNRVYTGNRTDGSTLYENSVYNGTPSTGFFDMGCPPLNATFTLTAGSSGGHLGTGLYYYVITYLYNGNQESFAIGGADNKGWQSVTPTAGQKVTISSIPVGDTRVTARKIYRTKSGTTDFYLLGVIQDRVTTIFVDALSDDNLGDAIDSNLLWNFNKPFKSKFVCSHKDRLFLGDLEDSFFSPIDTSYFTLTGDNIGGGGLSLGTYKYRIRKIWYNGGRYVLGNPVEISVVLSGAHNSVHWVISSSLADEKWFAGYSYERTLANGTTFYGGAWVTPNTTTGFWDILSDSGIQFFIRPSYFDVTDGETVYYHRSIVASSVGKPDLFPLLEPQEDGTLLPTINEWRLDEPMTGIFSDRDRLIISSLKHIYELDTRPVGKQFWKLSKAVEGIGAVQNGMAKTGDGFIFVQSTLTTQKDKLVIYEWNGRDNPVNCSVKIQNIIDDLSITSQLTVKGVIYSNKSNKAVIIVSGLDALTTAKTYILEYDMNLRDELGLGTWAIHHNNTTALGFETAICPSGFDVLFGSDIGYINTEKLSIYQDSIGATPTATNYTARVKTKRFEFPDKDIRPREIKIVTEGNGTADITLKYAVDNGSQTSKTLTGAVINGVKRTNNTDFTGAKENRKRNVDFELQHTANTTFNLNSIHIKLIEESTING